MSAQHTPSKSYAKIMSEIGVVTRFERNRFGSEDRFHTFQDHQLVQFHAALDAQSKAREDRDTLLERARIALNYLEDGGRLSPCFLEHAITHLRVAISRATDETPQPPQE